jgi:hypothetical protein
MDLGCRRWATRNLGRAGTTVTGGLRFLRLARPPASSRKVIEVCWPGTSSSDRPWLSSSSRWVVPQRSNSDISGHQQKRNRRSPGPTAHAAGMTRPGVQIVVPRIEVGIVGQQTGSNGCP